MRCYSREIAEGERSIADSRDDRSERTRAVQGTCRFRSASLVVLHPAMVSITRTRLSLATQSFAPFLSSWLETEHAKICPAIEIVRIDHGSRCEILLNTQYRSRSEDLLVAGHRPTRPKPSTDEVLFLVSASIRLLSESRTHFGSSSAPCRLPSSGRPSRSIPSFSAPSTAHCHGHRLSAAIVKVVSKQFESVRVEQNHCQGLQTVRASYPTQEHRSSARHGAGLVKLFDLNSMDATYSCPRLVAFPSVHSSS